MVDQDMPQNQCRSAKTIKKSLSIEISKKGRISFINFAGCPDPPLTTFFIEHSGQPMTS